MAIDNEPSPRFQDYVCQAQPFLSNDHHWRAALKQVSPQNLPYGAGVLFYTNTDGMGRQRYEGQIKNALPGIFLKVKQKKNKKKLFLKFNIIE